MSLPCLTIGRVEGPLHTHDMDSILSTSFQADDDEIYMMAVLMMLEQCVQFARLALAHAVEAAEDEAEDVLEWSEGLRWNIANDVVGSGIANDVVGVDNGYEQFELGCVGYEPEVVCDVTVKRFANDFTFSRATFTVIPRKGEVVTIECESMEQMQYALNRLAKEIVTFCKSAKPSGKKWRTWLVRVITSMLAIQSAGITTTPVVSVEQVPQISTAEVKGFNFPNLG